MLIEFYKSQCIIIISDYQIQDLLKDRLLSPAHGLNRPLQQEPTSQVITAESDKSTWSHKHIEDGYRTCRILPGIQRVDTEHAESFRASLLSSTPGSHDQNPQEPPNVNTEQTEQ